MLPDVGDWQYKLDAFVISPILGNQSFNRDLSKSIFHQKSLTRVKVSQDNHRVHVDNPNLKMDNTLEETDPLAFF